MADTSEFTIDVGRSPAPKMSSLPWLILVLVLVHFLWRFGCFVWLPLNLQEEWPGAIFEASAIASTGLFSVWIVLGDGRPVWRVSMSIAGVIILWLVQDAGLLICGWLHDRWDGSTFAIFWFVEGEVASFCFLAALGFRLIFSWRISNTLRILEKQPAFQIRLLNLFLLTALVALVLGTLLKWFQEVFRNDSWGINRILFCSALAISLSSFPALLLLGNRRWWTIPLLVGGYLALPSLIFSGCRLAGLAGTQSGFHFHLATLVAGSALAAGATTLTLRYAGYRWVPAKDFWN